MKRKQTDDISKKWQTNYDNHGLIIGHFTKHGIRVILFVNFLAIRHAMY
jgi:hypothetical protein